MAAPSRDSSQDLLRLVGELRRLNGPGSLNGSGGRHGGGRRPGVGGVGEGRSRASRGVVTAVEGRLITVRWGSGSSSTFVPSAGCLQVTGHEPQAETVDSS